MFYRTYIINQLGAEEMGGGILFLIKFDGCFSLSVALIFLAYGLKIYMQNILCPMVHNVSVGISWFMTTISI